jgi:hypothetical protein
MSVWVYAASLLVSALSGERVACFETGDIWLSRAKILANGAATAPMRTGTCIWNHVQRGDSHRYDSDCSEKELAGHCCAPGRKLFDNDLQRRVASD